MFELDVMRTCMNTSRFVKFICGPIEADYFDRIDYTAKYNQFFNAINRKSQKRIKSLDKLEWIDDKYEQSSDIADGISCSQFRASHLYHNFLVQVRAVTLIILFLVLSIHLFIIKSNYNEYTWIGPFLSNPYGCFKNPQMYNGINFTLVVLHILIFCRNINGQFRRNNPKYYRKNVITIRKLELAYMSCIRVSTYDDFRCLLKATYLAFVDRWYGIYPEKLERPNKFMQIYQDHPIRSLDKVGRLLDSENLIHLVFKYNLIDFDFNYRYYAMKLIELNWEKEEIVWKCRWISPKKYHSLYKQDFHLPMPIHRTDLVFLGAYVIICLISIIWEIYTLVIIQTIANILELQLIKRTQSKFQELALYDYRMLLEMCKVPHILRMHEIFAISFNHITHHIEAMFALLSSMIFYGRLSKIVNLLEVDLHVIEQIDMQIDTQQNQLNSLECCHNLAEMPLLEKRQYKSAKIDLIMHKICQDIRYNIKLIDVLHYEFRDIKRKHSNMINILIISNIIIVPLTLSILIKNDYYSLIETIMPLSILVSCLAPFISVAITSASIDTMVSFSI